MSGRLRRRYQRLLLTYPTGYRAAHGEEILSTLLEAARPTQRWPSWRESTSLLLGGLRLRARQAAKESPTRLWTDGLHLGVLLVVLVNLGSALETRFLLWTALVAVGGLAVLRGWGRTALAATAFAALAVARPLLPHSGLPWWQPSRRGTGRAMRRHHGEVAALGRLSYRAISPWTGPRPSSCCSGCTPRREPSTRAVRRRPSGRC